LFCRNGSFGGKGSLEGQLPLINSPEEGLLKTNPLKRGGNWVVIVFLIKEK
jgi:hypothetical protein